MLTSNDIWCGIAFTGGWIFGVIQGTAWYWFPFTLFGWLAGVLLYRLTFALIAKWRTAHD